MEGWQTDPECVPGLNNYDNMFSLATTQHHKLRCRTLLHSNTLRAMKNITNSTSISTIPFRFNTHYIYPPSSNRLS